MNLQKEGYTTFVFQDDDCYECFGFAAPEQKNIIHSYFNNWDILVRFKHYFTDKSNKLIKAAEHEKIRLSHDNNRINTEDNSHMPFNRRKLEAILKPKHYKLYQKGGNVKITAREFDCLKCLAQGRTNKEIGKILNISPRTVENYHQRLKEKLEVHSNTALIDSYLASDLIVL